MLLNFVQLIWPTFESATAQSSQASPSCYLCQPWPRQGKYCNLTLAPKGWSKGNKTRRWRQPASVHQGEISCKLGHFHQALPSHVEISKDQFQAKRFTVFAAPMFLKATFLKPMTASPKEYVRTGEHSFWYQLGYSLVNKLEIWYLNSQYAFVYFNKVQWHRTTTRSSQTARTSLQNRKYCPWISFQLLDRYCHACVYIIVTVFQCEGTPSHIIAEVKLNLTLIPPPALLS